MDWFAVTYVLEQNVSFEAESKFRVNEDAIHRGYKVNNSFTDVFMSQKGDELAIIPLYHINPGLRYTEGIVIHWRKQKN